jgi:hypothetical protein
VCRRGCNSLPLRRFRNLPLIPCRSGDGHGLTTIYWNARDVAGIKVHIGSLSDSLFAVGGLKDSRPRANGPQMESSLYLVDASSESVLTYYADGSQAGPDAVNLASAVAIPPGESSTALGIWDTADGYSTQAEFQGDLFNAAQGEQFRGRVVNETSAIRRNRWVPFSWGRSRRTYTHNGRHMVGSE